MRVKTIRALYFSATGTTETAVKAVAAAAAAVLDCPWQAVSFTLPQERQEDLVFGPDELVVVGVPVYAGRVPNVLLPFLTQKLAGRLCLCGGRRLCGGAFLLPRAGRRTARQRGPRVDGGLRPGAGPQGETSDRCAPGAGGGGGLRADPPLL